MDEQHAILLGEALKAGAFSRLGVLQFGGQRVYGSVWEALGAGSCPELRVISLSSAQSDSDSATAFMSALVSRSLNKLQGVDLEGNRWGEGDDDGRVGDAALTGVVSALALSCCDLQFLKVSNIYAVRGEATKALLWMP